MPSFKVIIAEKDGLELEYNSEYDLLTALTELGIGEATKNFSYHKIAMDESISIQSNQHMISTSLEVDGFLNVEGSVVFL